MQLAEFQQNDVTPLDNPTTSVSELFSQQLLDSAQLHIFVKRPSIGTNSETVVRIHQRKPACLQAVVGLSPKYAGP